MRKVVVLYKPISGAITSLPCLGFEFIVNTKGTVIFTVFELFFNL